MKDLPPFLRAHPHGTTLALKVLPRASRNQIGPAEGDALKIRVTAPPVDAAANEALVELLAEQLDCPRRAVEIIRGQTARHKTVLVRDLTPEAVLEKLAGA